jgi:pterin-4a-carbinolamine dehydratase
MVLVMKRIFISYRRSDFYNTNRLAKVLQNEFGPNITFFDTESMEPGANWPTEIQNALMRTDLMLLIIGPNWLHVQDELSGKRRIDISTDWVRKEITTFLERMKNAPQLVMIPVLVNGAKMPEKKYLDKQICPICYLQCIVVTNTGKASDFDGIRRAIKDKGIYPVNLEPVSTPLLGPRPGQLTQEEEDEFLTQYQKWMIVENDKPGISGDYMRQLYRLFEFSNYETAWRFILKVDEKAIRPFDHHPRWQNTWNRVEFWLCTFNTGHKPSKKDIRLAKNLEKIWEEEFKPTRSNST